MKKSLSIFVLSRKPTKTETRQKRKEREREREKRKARKKGNRGYQKKDTDRAVCRLDDAGKKRDGAVTMERPTKKKEE